MEIIYIVFSLLFGACFGSFISMASHRLPKNEDIFVKKSYCPNCNKPIKFLSLIPIFSWIFQGGKCSNCKNKISIRYPLIEITTAILFVLSYLKFGSTYNTIVFDLIIVVCMIMLVSDLETYIIPDSMQISLLLLSLIMILLNHQFANECRQCPIPTLYSIYGYQLFSAFVYFITIYATGFIVEKWKKKEAIGGGDVKFITIAGLLLGLNNLPIFLFISGAVGIIFGLIWKKVTKNEYFPFGPALIIAYIFILLCL